MIYLVRLLIFRLLTGSAMDTRIDHGVFLKNAVRFREQFDELYRAEMACY